MPVIETPWGLVPPLAQIVLRDGRLATVRGRPTPWTVDLGPHGVWPVDPGAPARVAAPTLAEAIGHLARQFTLTPLEG